MSWRDYKVDTLLTTLSIFNNELVRERGTVTVCSTVQYRPCNIFLPQWWGQEEKAPSPM
jgi:hypothetical protein